MKKSLVQKLGLLGVVSFLSYAAAVAFAPLMAWFYAKNRQRGMGKLAALFCQWKAWIPVALIAAAMMWYNYIRFDNPLEFGHNYLPEFVGSEHGQFDIYYLKDNLLKLLFYPVRIKEGLTLDYPFFDGFMFYVANPLFILFFAAAARKLAGAPPGCAAMVG